MLSGELALNSAANNAASLGALTFSKSISVSHALTVVGTGTLSRHLGQVTQVG